MECIDPVYVKKVHMNVRCGKCLPCIDANRQQWAVRLHLEKLNSLTAYFITLTFNNENYEEEFTEKTKTDFQSFLKRLRHVPERGLPNDYKGKKLSKIEGKEEKIKYFAVCERGKKFNRLHWHLILFNFPYDLESTDNILLYLWGKGFHKIGNAKSGSMEYITDYLFKNVNEKNYRYMSKGLGEDYATENKIREHRVKLDPTIHIHGEKKIMPRYIKDKVYTKNEKKALADLASSYLLDRRLENPTELHEKYLQLQQKVKFKKSKR